MLGKVEICGVNTSRLQTLSNEEMMRLIELAQKGDQAAKQRLVEGNLKLVLRERFAHGQPVTLGALEGTLSREEIEHLTMVVNRKDMTVSEQAMDDYIRTIEEEYTRTHCRGGDTLLQMARQKKETGGYGG